MKYSESAYRPLKKGFSLIELLLSLVVVGFLTLVAVQQKDVITSRINENSEIKNITLLHMTVQDIGKSGDYRGLRNSLVRGFNLFPSRMKSENPDAIKTSWADYGVELREEEDRGAFSGFGNNSKNAFSMTYYSVPSSACNKLIANSESLFYKIEINGNSVKDESNASTGMMGSSAKILSSVEVARECGTELDINTIKFYSK